VFTKLKLTQVSIILSPTSIFNSLFATFVAMALSLPDLPVELIYRTLNFIPSKENAIIQVHETCRALALKTTELFARKYFSSGSWRLTQRTVSALTGISKNKYLNPTLKHITLFRYTNEYEYDLRYSLAKGIDIKELGQSLQTLANLRSLTLADFNFRGSEKFLGDLLAALSLPLITDFRLLKVVVHASNIGKFITLHSNTIKTVVFDELDLTAPAKGAWSRLLSSLTCLEDVKLIHIRKPLKCGEFVRFEPEDSCDPTFQRYVDWDATYNCGCDICLEHAGQNLHRVFGEYRLGTDAKKEDWTRGLELMVAGSRTAYVWGDSDAGDPDP
jgi:hypothetical protein